MSASAVRAGRAFVEITANDTEFQRGMKRVQHSVVRLGGMMRQMGSSMAIAGGVMGLPMVLAARQAATFEDALLELKGAAGELTAGDLKRAKDEALALSKALGVAPQEVSKALALLVKAGMDLEDAINGGAKAAVEFSRVAGVEASQAAEFMSDSMSVFGLSADEAANILSAAADSSSTSIAQMVEGFGQVASVAKGTGQSLFGLAQAMAALAPYSIKGEEAGTGIKTLLTKLVAPTKEAEAALGTLGISMGQLYDETGKLLPIAQIADVFQKAMAGMSDDAKKAIASNRALVDIFDVRGIKVIQAFADLGKEGFSEIATKMEQSRSVSEKYAIAMAGITGAFNKLYSSVERLAIAFMEGAGPALGMFAAAAVPVIDSLAWLLTNMPVISGGAAVMAAALFGLGTAAYAVGGAFAIANVGLKLFINIGPTFLLAVRSMTSVIGGLSKALIGLRIAMFAIPVWGWALAGIAAAVGIGAWMLSGSGSKKGSAAKGSGIKRDADRKALGDAGPQMAGGPAKRGDSIGVFSGQVASMLGIGPALTSAEETANNTARMADGVDQLVRQGEARIPKAADLQAGMQPMGIRGGVAARSDRDLVSMSERAAIAAEESRNYLRQLVEKHAAGIAFV